MYEETVDWDYSRVRRYRDPHVGYPPFTQGLLVTHHTAGGSDWGENYSEWEQVELPKNWLPIPVVRPDDA
jgi:hypothetical protein